MTPQSPTAPTPPTTPTPPTPTEVSAAWERVADGFDRHTTPQTIALGEELVDRLGIREGTRVLDVAAGSGALAIPAARAGAEVTAVDIAPTMVERLRARADAEGLDVTARVADGTALDLDADTVDLTVSLNGISLFGDLASGLHEAVRVTRPGGEVAIATFGPLPQVEFVAFFLGAVRAAAGDDVAMPPGPLPPFRLADPDVLAATLEDAGLRDVTVEPLSWQTRLTSADHLLQVALGSNPIAGRLLGGLSDEQRDQVRAVLAGMLRERSDGDGGAVLHNRLHLGRGTA